MQSKIEIAVFSNPFNLRQKTVSYVDVGTSFIEYLKVAYPNGFERPARVLLNGSLLDVENFDVVFIENDSVTIQILPADPISIGISLLAGAAVAAAVVYLINQPEIPSLEFPDTLSSLRRQGGRAYNLRQQENIARLYEPIPTQYGKLRTFSDLAASPWVYFSENDQYLNQLFCLGWGQFDIESIQLGNMQLQNFDGIEYEVYGPNETVTLFHDNMYTSPSLNSFEVYHANRFLRSDDHFYFDKTGKRIDGVTPPTLPNFNEFLEAGDTILIGCASFPAFEGEFLIDSVTDSEIYLDDVSSWPGNNNNPGTVYIWKKSEVKYLSPALTDRDYPDTFAGYPSRVMFMNYTNGYITSPVGTTSSVFYVDIEFRKGLYFRDMAGLYQDRIALFEMIFRPIDEDGTYSGTVVPVTSDTMEGSGTTWRPTLLFPTESSHRRWDSQASFTFYDNGTPIDAGDIASIDYGDGWGGAHVVFTGSKTGPITYDGSYITMPVFSKTYSITGSSPLLRRYTMEFDMTAETGWTAGRFEVYIGHLNVDPWADDDYQSDAIIVGLKTKLDAVGKYGPYTMLAVKLKATADITAQNSKKFNVLATRKLLQWSGSAWTGPTATRSIAWALSDIWMSTYGASRPSANLDLATLSTLDTLWTSRGDTFDGIFDSSITVWEALQKVARAGRCRPVFDGTVLTFVRDGAQSTYTAVFGPDNILPNTFTLDYSFPDDQTPSIISIKYWDEDNNYSPALVLSSNNGGKIREVDFFGIVNYEQAWRESQYLEAQILRQRLNIKFTTEMVGHIPFYGDLISVQYDLPSWGQGGQVVSKSGTTITTNQPLDWSGSAPFYISFMKPDGGLSGPHTVTQGTGNFEAVLATDVTSFTFITVGSNQNPTIYQFGPSTNWNRACVITKVTPNADNETLAIQCVPYDAAIHTADQGTPPTKPSVTPTGNPIPPDIGGLTLSNVPGSGSVVAVWNPLNDIDNYKVQKSTDNTSWSEVSTPSVATETISATGVLYVRVASVINSIVGDYSKKVIIAT